ncbi:MAG: hypothetical protein KAJ03_12615, partial [Gammaproteobacteria bacterium]|nr:hypothetical protein [Gammaproteobacteria bacterium]
MTLLYCESFEAFNIDDDIPKKTGGSFINGASINTVDHRTGSQCWRYIAGNTQVMFGIPFP